MSRVLLLVRMVLTLGTLCVWSSVGFGWVISFDYGSVYGKAGFAGDNGSVTGLFGQGADTWANTHAQMNAYSRIAEHELGGGAFDETSVSGEIESTQPLWIMTATGSLATKAIGSRLAGFGGTMISRAHGGLLMDGEWSYWAGCSSELHSSLDHDAPAEYYPVYLGHDSQGQERTIELGGTRKGFADYPGYRIVDRMCHADWAATSSSNRISFEYKTSTHCYQRFEFDSSSIYPFMIASVKQLDAGNPDCAQWEVRLRAYDGNIKVEDELFN